ncbi:MAG TPA: mechanosensitive ion channel family protein [Rhodopila sp.]
MHPNALTRAVEAIDRALAWAPSWLIGLIVLLGSASVALLLYNWSLRLVGRLARHFGTLPQMLIAHSRGPVAAILVVSVLGATLPAVQFSSAVTSDIAYGLVVAFILSLGWAATNGLRFGALVYLGRFRVDVADNLLARKHVTQVRILVRALQTLIAIIATGIALMTIPEVRQFGVSLFASAGAAGLVVGLAARPVLSNLLAGIQIAITQPIREEDAVVVEGEWGWIETINSTYVVVRIWDLRRLILPLTYFIEQPFQNWTHENADLLGSVMLNVDYSVPVEPLRAELNKVVHASKLWDGKVAVLQVTDTPGNMVQLRALVSARDSGTAWDLRCEVREKLIGFLQQQYPEALPRQRADLSGDAVRGFARRDRTPEKGPALVRPDDAA